MILFIYVALLFLVLRFSVTLFNFLSNPKLGYYGRRFSDRVLILVRDCGNREELDNLLLAIREQDHPNIEVVVQLPSEEALMPAGLRPDYTLRLDSDTIIHKALIHNMIYRMKVFKLGLLSLVPRRKMRSWKDYLYYPVSDFMLLNLFPLRLARYVRLPVFAGPGKGVVMTSQRDGDRWEVLLANKFAFSTAGPEKGQHAASLFSLFNHNTAAALIYIVLLIGGPVALLMSADLQLLALPFGLIFLTRIMVSFLTGQNPLINLLLHPLQMLLLAGSLLSRIFVDIRKR
jgi:hypothetical protein